MSKFLKNIPVYFINLNSRKDRLNYILNHFAKNKVNIFFRVEAIDAKDLMNDTNLSNSELACTLSHLKAIKEFYDSPHEFAFICEDDIDMDNLQKINFNFLETLNYYSPNMYCIQLSVSTREDLNINFDLHDRTFWDFSTVAYIINRQYAKKILDTYFVDSTLNLNNFSEKKILDYRGGNILTRAVADELVYSIENVKSWPVFTFQSFQSDIGKNDESFRQVIHSINLFNSHWNKNKYIDLNNFIRGLDDSKNNS